MLEERDRILSIKMGLRRAIQTSESLSYRSNLPINRKIIDRMEHLSWLVGLHWIFLTKDFMKREEIHASDRFPGAGINVIVDVDRPLSTCTILPDDWGMEHIAVMLQIYPSLSQARKSNWKGEPKPYHKGCIGPGKIHAVTIL